MKCVLIAFAVFVAAVSAKPSTVLSTYSIGTPIAPIAYSAPLAYPYAYGTSYAYGAPYATQYAYASPLAIAPAIQSGYVAATRGSLHVAPHPEGPLTASHHINTLPAPGTL